jgi:hypothetical protein
MKLKNMILMITIITLTIFNLAGATQRLVLCEKYTNTSCSGCYQANLVMDQIAENYPDQVAVIRCHVSWPSEYDPFYTFNPYENMTRTNYYGITSVPRIQIDGLEGVESESQYWTMISIRHNVPSPLEINLSGILDPVTRAGTLHVEVTATSDISLDGLFLRVTLTESNINWPAPNGLHTHNQTFRWMFPYSIGERIYLQNTGDQVEIDRDITCPESIIIENCELVVYVQSEENKEILQAAKISVPDIMTGIDDEPDLPGSFSLSQNYPNPFNAGTAIDYIIENAGEVKLAIYDVLGQEITTLVDEYQNPGRYNVKWSGVDNSGRAVASGMYFYRLVTEDESSCKRMILLK